MNVSHTYHDHQNYFSIVESSHLPSGVNTEKKRKRKIGPQYLSPEPKPWCSSLSSFYHLFPFFFSFLFIHPFLSHLFVQYFVLTVRPCCYSFIPTYIFPQIQFLPSLFYLFFRSLSLSLYISSSASLSSFIICTRPIHSSPLPLLRLSSLSIIILPSSQHHSLFPPPTHHSSEFTPTYHPRIIQTNHTSLL